MSRSNAASPRSPAAPGPGNVGHLPEAIGLARVLSVLGIVYVHAWTGLTAEQLAVAPAGQATLRWTLMEVSGRSAVPLLGLISGWLVAGSVERRGYPAFVAAKARALLLPMLSWNALAILLVSGAAALGLLAAPVPGNWWWFIDELLALATTNHINVQTPFLRDLFVCMLLAPLLLRLPTVALLAVMGGIVAWIGMAPAVPLLLRPAILLFFIVGMLVRRHVPGERLGSLPPGPMAVVFVPLIAAKVWLELRMPVGGLANVPLAAVADIAFRLLVALFTWAIVCRLAPTPVGQWLRRFEPYAFLMFCSHLIILWLLGPLLGKLTGPLGSPAYPAYLLLQPALLAGATLLIAAGLRHLPEGVAAALSGGRLGKGEVG